MRTSLRSACAAVLATVVVLSVPLTSFADPAPGKAASGDAPRTAPEPVQPLVREITGSRVEAVLDELATALAPTRQEPRTLGDPLPRKDVTLLLRDAVAARGSMTARQQSIFDDAQFGRRPVAENVGCEATDSGLLGLERAWAVLESANFCVHYSPQLSLSSGGASLSQAQTTLATMENVYAKEIGQFGYRPPVSDADGKFDIFLDQLGDQGLYGFCAPDANLRVTTAWCGLDNDFAVREFGAPPLNSLRVTAAHEFFHAVQYAYDAGDSRWFLEGTAAWMEDQVYPQINDYLQYLTVSQLRNWRQSTDFVGNLHVYSSVIFWKFLSERFGDADIVRQIWDRAASPGTNGIGATAAELAQRRTSLAREFGNYGVWNTLRPRTYADRGIFPVYKVRGCSNVRWCPWTTRTLSAKNRSTGGLSVRLNHLSTAPLILRTTSSLPRRSRLAVTVNAPNTSRGSQARVQVRFKNGRASTFTITLNGAGNGTKVVAFNPRTVRSAIVTLSNGSTGFNNELYQVRARVR